MKKQTLWILGAAFVLGSLWTGPAFAEDAAPADMADASVAVDAAAESASDTAYDAEEAASSIEDNLDNLEFASGEATGFDGATGKLQVKVYLDDAGNPAENTIELAVDSETEITDGEKDLDNTALKAGVEIDVEYDKTTNKATYVFVY